MTFLEELGDAAGSTDLADRVALDCLVRLRNTQIRDLEKLCLLSMLVTDSSRCIRQAEGHIDHLDRC
ncbi:hypothetical protein Tco_0188713 [Tanacetum coccineum]